MKGFIGKSAAVLGVMALLTASQGCYHYREIVDPCWPERYSHAARQSVVRSMAPQVNNGHVLDQTVWNYHFEAGTDRLTAGGLEKLAYLARRRPHPDPVVYLQTAQDILYDPSNPEKMTVDRMELDQKRRAAVERFLNAQTAGRGIAFQVVTHDPPETGLPATAVGLTVQQMYGRFRGGLSTGTGIGGGVSTTGGAGTSVPQ